MSEQASILDEGLKEQVRAGLSTAQKTLPSKFLYDELGSILFEAICVLPEYYLTRTEHAILEENAAQITADLQPGAWLVELGAGSATKTQVLIKQMLTDRKTLVYCPIDISREALRIAEANTVSRYPAVTFKGIQGDWFQALERLRGMGAPQKLIAFLGSSIGNLDFKEQAGFLAQLARNLTQDDLVLLGTDMVKPVAELLPAYDDPVGVTAAFNRNILVRLNQALDGDFDPRRFRHEARWNREHSRVEMHLVADEAQDVHLRRIGGVISFEKGESLHTENSHKFTPEKLETIVAQAGLEIKQVWQDKKGRFRLNLLGWPG